MVDQLTTPERRALVVFLDAQREGLIAKLDGLTEADARRTPTVSAMSLLGIVRHSAHWERRWFQVIFAGRSFPGDSADEIDAEGDAYTFRLADGDTIDSVVAEYRANIAASNDLILTGDLDAHCSWSDVADRDLRWVALHMIEETARHAGHADILRESIDGVRTPPPG